MTFRTSPARRGLLALPTRSGAWQPGAPKLCRKTGSSSQLRSRAALDDWLVCTKCDCGHTANTKFYERCWLKLPHVKENALSGNNYASFDQFYSEGPRACFVQTMKSPGGILNMVEATQPSGDMYDPAVPDIVLYQDVIGGTRIQGNLGGGKFDVKTERGGFVVAAPDCAIYSKVPTDHHIRAFAFPMLQWRDMLDEAAEGKTSLDDLGIFKGTFAAPQIISKLRTVWSLCEEEGAPSRLLARAAGCEILAELYRLGGMPLAQTRGGLATWAERRCIELMRARFSEDISLDELAAEARLSPFHFARMFKHSVGVPPRVYLTQLRMERTCYLLQMTDLPITDIALEVGYSSNQVLARVFLKHQRMTPSEYRRLVRDPTRASFV